MSLRLPVLACLCVLAACSSGEPAPAPAAADRAPALRTSTPLDADAHGPFPDAPPGLRMRYRCEGGHRVDVLESEARVRLDDGRTVLIERVAGSAPPSFAGEALGFRVTSGGAELAQDEGGRYSCLPA